MIALASLTNSTTSTPAHRRHPSPHLPPSSSSPGHQPPRSRSAPSSLIVSLTGSATPQSLPPLLQRPHSDLSETFVDICIFNGAFPLAPISLRHRHSHRVDFTRSPAPPSSPTIATVCMQQTSKPIACCPSPPRPNNRLHALHRLHVTSKPITTVVLCSPVTLLLLLLLMSKLQAQQ